MAPLKNRSTNQNESSHLSIEGSWRQVTHPPMSTGCWSNERVLERGRVVCSQHQRHRNRGQLGASKTLPHCNPTEGQKCRNYSARPGSVPSVCCCSTVVDSIRKQEVFPSDPPLEGFTKAPVSAATVLVVSWRAPHIVCACVCMCVCVCVCVRHNCVRRRGDSSTLVANSYPPARQNCPCSFVRGYVC